MAVAASQTTIRWGLKLFSSGGGGGGNNTCNVAAGAEVPIALNNGMAIQDRIDRRDSSRQHAHDTGRDQRG